MDVFGESYDDRPLDGESILPLIQNKPFKRKKTIGFKSRNYFAWNAEQYKLYAEKWGEKIEMYDLLNDPGEKADLAAQKPELLQQLRSQYAVWESSVRDSFKGKEYGRESYDRLKQKWPEKKEK